jgi:dipeptidyl aminopeptidase/acylaminoacyl peptidase
MAISPIPYGAWTSAFTTDFLVSTSIGLGKPTADGDDIYWTELRPTEGGRAVIVRRSPDGTTEDVTPAPFNARTRVHEYGGGAITYAGNGQVYFSNFQDQKLYRVRPTEAPQPLTNAEEMRYADGAVDTAHNRLICVREDHTVPESEAVTTIVGIDTTTGAETILVEGHDFFSNPRLGPDGQLSWLAWDHPNMPWDGTELCVATFDADGRLGPARVVAGGRDESVFQPTWSPDGRLYFVSDRSGWWNLYRLADGVRVERVTEPIAAEFGEPQWVFGMTRFAFASADTIVCAYQDVAGWHLATVDTRTSALTDIETPYTSFNGLSVHDGHVVTVAASPSQTVEVVRIDIATGESEVLRRSQELDLDPSQLSSPQAVEFPTTGGLTAYAFFYPPRNDNHAAPEGEKPPLVVFSHGGPTSHSEPVLSLDVQFWTSRGIAVLDVNYGGSSGYGRAYRQRLNGNWGVVDMDDCVNGALHLVNEGLVDGDRLAIRGGSAGGYTTLCALTFRDVFKAGASYFGVGDLAALATDTHKFESRYLDTMIGPYPECADLYAERSPIHHVDQLDCPVIFFQGMDDHVVPPAQAESMVAALRTKGVPVAYLPFEGEGHGFRKAENIKRSTGAELSFYGRIFGFTPAGDVEPIDLS